MLPKFLPKMQAAQIRGMPERKNGIVATKLPKLQGRGERKFNKNYGSQFVEIGVEKKILWQWSCQKLEERGERKNLFLLEIGGEDKTYN